jgi:hypothetical protein
MSRTVYNYGSIVQPDNVELYLKVNPGAFEVVPCRGGFKPLDKKRWAGNLPIKAEEL